MKKIISLLLLMLLTLSASAEKKSVFLYAGQSNADGREYTTQEAYKNNNSLTKNLTEGFASLVELRRDRHIVADAILVEGGLGQRGLRDSIVKDLSRLGLYGTIVSEWKREQGGIAWHVVIPANTTATLFTPKGKREIGSGSYQFFFF